MVTKQHLELLKEEMDRCDTSGDPGEQRRAAVFGPLVEFALWAHSALIALGAEALPDKMPEPEAPAVANSEPSPGKRSRKRR